MRLACGDHQLDLSRPRIMGVVNITPDSFSDGGRYLDPGAATDHALRLVEEGADIIDLGAESTRPGSTAITESEELERLGPVLTALADVVRVPISVDTKKAAVMRAAADLGASMINDVSGLTAPGALDAVADSGLGLCIMHSQGEPRTMQEAPRYEDVVAEVYAFLQGRVSACEDAGISRRRLAIDPGFGFGKTLEHNLQLLRHLGRFRAEGLPLLVGLSRKSMLESLTGRAVSDRLAGSLGLAWAALSGGARILRVHDVAETRDLIAVWQALQTR